MASQTTNIGLVKPAYSESADVSILNTNMDTIDAAFGSSFSNKSVRQELDDQSNVDTNLEGSMAILANGNTHAAVASGQYVYVRNHGTLTEGLYKATAAIAANGGLTTSNLTAASSGGLNDLKGQIDSLNSNFISVYDALTPASGWSGDLRIARCGKQRIIYGALKPSNVGTRMVAYTLGESDRPPITIKAPCSSYSLTAQSEISLGNDGIMMFNVPSGGNANNLVFNFSYFVQ